jgi:hypothetical protein
MNDFLVRCLSLKPFDESADLHAKQSANKPSLLLVIVTVLSASTALITAGLLLCGQHRTASLFFGVSIALTAFASGLQWHTGIKATGLNQLFQMVLATAIYCAFLLL